MGTIDQRLQALERDLVRSRRVNRVLLLAALAVACIAGAQGNSPDQSKSSQSSPQSGTGPSAGGRRPERNRLRTVEADQFVLLDRDGRCRMKMQVTDDGPAISMFDEEGQKRLEMSQTSGATGLRLFDSSEPVVSLQLRHNGDPAQLEIRSAQGNASMKSSGVSVQDASEHTRLLLALVNGNFPVLGINQSGQSGPSSIELTANDSQRALKFHDKLGHPSFSVFSADNGDTTLSMRHAVHEQLLQISTGAKDREGPELTFLAPANEDGSGGILPRLQLGLGRDGQPHVRIVDRDGKTLFAAPSK